MGQRRRGRDKKGLAVAVEQLECILDHVPLAEGQLHPYTLIYLYCLRYGDGMTGRPALPMTGGVIEQDAELLLAFDLFEQAREERIREERDRDKREAELAKIRPTNIINGDTPPISVTSGTGLASPRPFVPFPGS